MKTSGVALDVRIQPVPEREKTKSGIENRKHRRVPIDEPVRAVQRDTSYNGRIKDVSHGGAAVQMEGVLDDESLVELHFENLAMLTGHIARPLDDGFALAFELDDDEDAVVDDIIRNHGGIGTEDY